MSRNPEDDSGGVFETAVFAVLMLAGVFIGREVVALVLPATEGTAIFGMLMLPLGVIVGVSIGLGSPPPESLLNLFSVLGGRHNVDEIVSRGGGSGSTTSLAYSIVAGTAATSALFGVLISVGLEPEIGMVELLAKLGLAGLVYGAIVGVGVALALSAD